MRASSLAGFAAALATSLTALLARAESPNAIGVVDDLADRVMLFRVTDGTYLGDLLTAAEGQLAAPLDFQLARSVRIGNVTYPQVVLVSDLRLARIVAFDVANGAYLGPIVSDAHVRGIALNPDGRLLAATRTAGVRSFTTAGATPTTLIGQDLIAGPHDAWDVLVRAARPGETADLLVADATLDAILRFSPTGVPLGVFAKRPEFRFVEQLAERQNRNVLAADVFGSAIHEFSADGTWLHAFPVTRPRGVAELRNGNLLVAAEDGVLEMDGTTGAILNVRMPGYPVSAPRYVTQLRCAGSIVVGDMNGSGATDFFDIDPLLMALLDAAAYTAAHPTVDPVCAGDVNGDGALSFFDIDAFVELLVP